MKNADLTPLTDKLLNLWSALDRVFGGHHMLTIVCAFFALMMTLSFYRLLKSISPALVAFICLLIFGMLVLNWTYTRTEPSFLTPAINYIAPFFPSAPNAAADRAQRDAASKPKPRAAKPKAPAPAK